MLSVKGRLVTELKLSHDMVQTNIQIDIVAQLIASEYILKASLDTEAPHGYKYISLRVPSLGVMRRW